MSGCVMISCAHILCDEGFVTRSVRACGQAEVLKSSMYAGFDTKYPLLVCVAGADKPG